MSVKEIVESFHKRFPTLILVGLYSDDDYYYFDYTARRLLPNDGPPSGGASWVYNKRTNSYYPVQLYDVKDDLATLLSRSKPKKIDIIEYLNENDASYVKKYHKYSHFSIGSLISSSK